MSSYMVNSPDFSRRNYRTAIESSDHHISEPKTGKMQKIKKAIKKVWKIITCRKKKVRNQAPAYEHEYMDCESPGQCSYNFGDRLGSTPVDSASDRDSTPSASELYKILEAVPHTFMQGRFQYKFDDEISNDTSHVEEVEKTSSSESSERRDNNNMQLVDLKMQHFFPNVVHRRVSDSWDVSHGASYNLNGSPKGTRYASGDGGTQGGDAASCNYESEVYKVPRKIDLVPKVSHEVKAINRDSATSSSDLGVSVSKKEN